jgi:hypothetical protein
VNGRRVGPRMRDISKVGDVIYTCMRSKVPIDRVLGCVGRQNGRATTKRFAEEHSASMSCHGNPVPLLPDGRYAVRYALVIVNRTLDRRIEHYLLARPCIVPTKVTY